LHDILDRSLGTFTGGRHKRNDRATHLHRDLRVVPERSPDVLCHLPGQFPTSADAELKLVAAEVRDAERRDCRGVIAHTVGNVALRRADHFPNVLWAAAPDVVVAEGTRGDLETDSANGE
jgi:hypothetical protein